METYACELHPFPLLFPKITTLQVSVKFPASCLESELMNQQLLTVSKNSEREKWSEGYPSLENQWENYKHMLMV